ncbi:hypothetical protein POM88_027910 [Heracleum sosnowskyi]|uniref:Uncharacterized protein n=1 Tax=Heracleum sosnowskyi TaxID=360622 RepID=A0AAD8IB38_9APIA|nr:hypothetical protein POM88_027901 [Heracleum sosnowskyi]KAK1381160.1 hypothetical protein POM88_027904 [Heracleum sosnowskyi]KAK1381163.1 hypothetical protein POM88_027907 [Heracleum sosnowskyi]KAK1381166.1 hypothetical protein POM88_027910 [Heracleum sosnowskyi]
MNLDKAKRWAISKIPSWIISPPKEDDSWLVHYAKDLNFTGGFEVGEYPYMSRLRCGSLITRYYFPPDITISDYALDKLTSFANLAIAQYNSRQNTKYGNVLVIKAMRSFSNSGFSYYLTFQGSLPGHPPQMFEAKLYDAPHWVSPPVTLQLVRLKNVN